MTRRILVSIAAAVAVAVGPAAAQDVGDAARGAAYAQRHCAACHGVLASDSESPQPRVATFRRIANTPGMTGTALAVWLRTPHRDMPNLVIAAEDRSDLIAYIVSLREPAAR